METDASSVLEVQVKDQAPKLHYIYPNCFEAGRPMEFVACGSHLLQPNFRYDLMHYFKKKLCVEISYHYQFHVWHDIILLFFKTL